MKSIKFVLISVLFFVSSTHAQDSQPQPVPQPPVQQQPSELLVGHWAAENIFYQQGLEIHTAFDFTTTSMTLIGLCIFPFGEPRQIEARVTAPVTFNGNEFIVLESRSSTSQVGDRYCRTYVQPARWQFYFNGTGKAILIAPAPYNTQLVLVRE